MKKISQALLVIVIITPSIAYASWWNPLSWLSRWSNLNKPENKTEILEMRIKELEEKLNVSSNATSTNKVILKPETAKPKFQRDSVKTSESKVKVIEIKKKDVEATDPAIGAVKVITPDITINEPFLTQSKFSGYGAYEIRLKIKANNDDIYIPLTSTDSTKGRTGFSYYIKGGEFKGLQKSKVSCSQIKENKPIDGSTSCFISKGQTLEVIATVWLTNLQFGNYSLVFNKLGYFTESDYAMKTYLLDKETEILYLN